MASLVEVELVVTISYKAPSPKASISSVGAAVTAIRQDLVTLGLGHAQPKKETISVVYAGRIRFSCTCPHDSTIYRAWMNIDSSKNRDNQFQHLLSSLSVEQIAVSERPLWSGAVPNGNANANVLQWKPDKGLFAVPPGPSSSSESESHARADPAPSPSAKWSWDRPESTSGPSSARYHDPWSKNRRREAAAEPAVRIKAEPVEMSIPLTAVEDVPSTPPTRTTSKRTINRNRNTSTPSKRTTSSAIDSHASERLEEVQTELAEIQAEALQTELLEIRRRIAGERQRERAVLEQLRTLGAVESADVDDDADSEARMRLRKMEAQLEVERARRRIAEAFAEDIRRECRAPFIVPALLDALEEISRVTSLTEAS